MGSPRTVRAFSDLLKSRKHDFLFLSETISNANKIEKLRVKFGFSQCFSVNFIECSGGLAVLRKHNVACEVTYYSQNHIDMNFMNNNATVWRLSCFYGYPDRTRRKNSWPLILLLVGNSHLRWCILVDFNDLLYASDAWGNVSHPQSLMAGFGLAICDCLLSEIDLSGGKYTWEKSRGTGDWVRE